jgi:membrane protein insertase Oxa1/YidC/SpoIIIJ
VLFGLYWALRNLSQSDPQFGQPFLWVPKLDQPDTFSVADFPLPGILPIATAITQYWDPQQRTKTMNRVMTIIRLGMMFFWGVILPAGLFLYWFVGNVFEMVLRNRLVTTTSDKP